MAASSSDAPATVQLPGCKSLSQRALILAATGSGECLLRGLSNCDDSRFLRRALEDFGARMENRPGGVLVHGMGGPPQGNPDPVDIGEAGSSLRFLLPLCAAGRGRFVLTGAQRLFERPHEELICFLRQCGTEIRPVEIAGRPGLEIQAKGLPSGVWNAPTKQSSQYLSGLMMAAAWSGLVQIEVPDDLPSRGYFDLTVDAIHAFRGANALRYSEDSSSQMLLKAGTDNPSTWTVPGDPSAATFFLVGNVLMGGRMQLSPPWSVTHPEAKLLQLFEEEDLLRMNHGVWTCQPASGRAKEPLRVAIDAAPDAGPALAVLGAYLAHGMHLHGIERLRIKESDRVAGMQRLLHLLGSPCEVSGDCLRIHPKQSTSKAAGLETSPNQSLSYHPDGDHRLAMAAGIAKLRCPTLSIQQSECVAKSFPDFWAQLKNAWA